MCFKVKNTYHLKKALILRLKSEFCVYLYMAYRINPDRTKPWNDLPELPIDAEIYQKLAIYEQLGNAKAALGRLQGRSIVIPNQGLLDQLHQLAGSKGFQCHRKYFYDRR